MSCLIFTAEPIAIFKAPEMIKEHSLRDFIIFSDYFSAVNSIKNEHNPFNISLQIVDIYLGIDKTNRGGGSNSHCELIKSRIAAYTFNTR